jgi:hypothetical protein
MTQNNKVTVSGYPTGETGYALDTRDTLRAQKNAAEAVEAAARKSVSSSNRTVSYSSSSDTGFGVGFIVGVITTIVCIIGLYIWTHDGNLWVYAAGVVSMIVGIVIIIPVWVLLRRRYKKYDKISFLYNTVASVPIEDMTTGYPDTAYSIDRWRVGRKRYGKCAWLFYNDYVKIGA